MKKKINKDTRVLVTLSGGVDSAVAAALLVKAGYSVTGAYMVNYDDKEQGTRLRPEAMPGGNKEQANVSCWVPDYRDAVRVAAKLGIPLIKLDFIKEYKKTVLDYMFAEYKAGRTPNPDILCNKFVKFGSWLDWARKHGYDYLATGHYARVKKLAISHKQLAKRNKDVRGLLIANCSLLISKDTNKDQTYFLNQLTQDQLRSVMFPIGGYTKPEVRKLAAKFGLPVANKEESMGICFIGEVSMKEFLEKRIKADIGNIVDSNGLVIGKHDGLAFYTIGQRHIGLARPLPNPPLKRGGNRTPSFQGGGRGRSSDNRPLYVVAKRPKTNELVVGYEDDQLLYSKDIIVKDVNWTGGQTPRFPLKCMVRLRHRQPLQAATVEFTSPYPPLKRGGTLTKPLSFNEQREHSQPLLLRRGHLPATLRVARRAGEEVSLTVRLANPQRAVTPGQFAVFYSPGRSSKGSKAGKAGECLGGGVIT